MDKHVVRDDGIHQNTRERATTPEAMRELLQGITNRHDIGWQLEQIEPAVLAILEDHGATIRAVGCGARLVDGIDNASPTEATLAKAALHWIDQVRGAIAGDDVKNAALCGLQLGYYVEGLKVSPFGPHAKRGLKIIEAAKAGGTEAHGTPEERQAQYTRFQADIDRQRTDNPARSYTQAAKNTAARFGVHKNTVLNHTTK